MEDLGWFPETRKREPTQKKRVKFDPFYADFWNVFPGTIFDVVKPSRSRHNLWIDMRGRGIVSVPKSILIEV